MSREEQGRGSDKVYYSVFNGAFRRRVPEGTPGALSRVNKNGKEVHELEVRALFGKIEMVAFEDSDYGKQLKITLDANDEGLHPVLSFGVESRDGRDVLRKLPALNLSKEVRIMPYSFIPDGETEKRSGISINQPNDNGEFIEKIENHFFDKEKKEFKHGHPTINWDLATEAQQKIFKIQRDEFLQQYTLDHVISKLVGEPHLTHKEIAPQDKKDKYDPDEIDAAFDEAFERNKSVTNADDLPF